MITFIGDQIYMSEYVTCPDVSMLRYISAETIINLLKPICEFSSSSVMYAPVGMMGRNVFFNALRSNWCIDWSFGQLKTLPHSVINKPTRQMSGYSSKMYLTTLKVIFLYFFFMWHYGSPVCDDIMRMNVCYTGCNNVHTHTQALKENFFLTMDQRMLFSGCIKP